MKLQMITQTMFYGFNDQHHCAGKTQVIQLSQITPIGIVFKIDRTLAVKITLNIPITVYSIQPDRKPTGVIQ